MRKPKRFFLTHAGLFAVSSAGGREAPPALSRKTLPCKTTRGAKTVKKVLQVTKMSYLRS